VTASYAVVGGGISGLVAAYRLRVAAGPDATITVFDPADRLGGVLRTERIGGQPLIVERFIQPEGVSNDELLRTESNDPGHGEPDGV